MLYGERMLPDGRWLTVYPLLFGRARLLVSRAVGVSSADDAW